MLKLRPHALLSAAAVTLVACQIVPQSVTPVAQLRGAYTFSEYLADQGTVAGMEIAGEIRFLGDTVLLDTQSASCRLIPPSGPRDAQIMHFDCAGLGITVDRLDPLNGSSYSMVTSAMENRTVCIVWGVDAKGNPICIQSGIESVPTSVTRSGHLRFHLKKG